MVIHDTECPYCDQVSLTSTNPKSFLLCCQLIYSLFIINPYSAEFVKIYRQINFGHTSVMYD